MASQATSSTRPATIPQTPPNPHLLWRISPCPPPPGIPHVLILFCIMGPFIYVSHTMCPHTTHMSAYYTYVLMLYMCSNAIFVSSYYIFPGAYLLARRHFKAVVLRETKAVVIGLARGLVRNLVRGLGRGLVRRMACFRSPYQGRCSARNTSCSSRVSSRLS
jgi:hypothetical protein